MQAHQIALGFQESERAEVGALYWEAFHRKLRPAFTSNDTGRRVVQAAMRPDRMLVARTEGVITGVCGFFETGLGAANLSWALLRHLLPTWQAIRASLVLSVLARNSKDHTLVLDGICVDSARRGEGTGTALLAAAVEAARQRRLRSVQLSVIDSNVRAEELYRRQGFSPTDTGSLGLLGYVYGFERYTVMEKAVLA
ncbi:GNAT family N-acetyltransferase [Microbacterium sp. LTA6]|uniref:GNAT family N-acetyltransferase n=1 Tax=unclassified Microbacterium TaxID=2609290 RepID=UPI003138A8E9